MYLFKNEYIRITDNKGLKFEGFYKSVNNINTGRIYTYSYNSPYRGDVTFAQKDMVKKYDVDILGYIGGEIKCGEPLLSITEKN